MTINNLIAIRLIIVQEYLCDGICVSFDDCMYLLLYDGLVSRGKWRHPAGEGGVLGKIWAKLGRQIHPVPLETIIFASQSFNRLQRTIWIRNLRGRR